MERSEILGCRRDKTMIKIVKLIHKRWVLKTAFSDVYYAADFLYAPGWGNRALYLHYQTQGLLWAMKYIYPIFFLILSFEAILAMLSVNTIADVIHLFGVLSLLNWSLFIYTLHRQ